MNYIKTADHNKNITTYENFISYCPNCDHRNIYNRREDLKTTQPISNKEVTCLNPACNTDFYINGDMLAEKYEYFIFEAQDLIREKKYMHAITMLCTSCESFFYQAINIKLVYEPFKDNIITDLDDMNMLFKLVDRNTKYYTFERLRNLFIYLYFIEIELTSLSKIVQVTNSLSKLDLPKEVQKILNDNVHASNAKKKQFLDKVSNLNINELRNQVVHKHAYRPLSAQAQLAIDTVTHIVTTAETIFDIQSEDNYINGSFRKRRR